jgi:hypothetical protein
VGNLRIDDAVNVNGLTKGSVKELTLTDSCVWTKIAVLSKVKIPVNSKMHVANSGLMGNRVVEIVLGDSNVYYEDGAYFTGSFDMGSTSIGVLVVDILEEAEAIVEILGSVADTLFSEERTKDYEILGHKAKLLGNKVLRMASSAERSAMASIDSLFEAKDKIVEIIDGIKPNLDGIVKDLDLLQENFANLEVSLEKFKNGAISMAEKLEKGDNTVSLALNKSYEGDLRREMTKISEDAEQLLNKIKKSGLDFNVTFWK